MGESDPGPQKPQPRIGSKRGVLCHQIGAGRCHEMHMRDGFDPRHQ